ncbi:helix-turn-helix domain-containing protein [Odoribacter sp. OttesenSCG-928-L07]|nr:helix-turn-helix domain-containing protein [Odoribacter sp. OttesenSCG-928-L07]MDL2239658.1 helix-turn-helix domain-containing protein [Bacteroidales bacterium OttesenSCG-928-L14]MDL2241083.1 helix-turn-helix domain-containing protein [Bacteroidales bacterium OttesenSCG-928-K22]
MTAKINSIETTSQQKIEQNLDEHRITHAAILFLGSNSHLYSMEKIGEESGFESYDAFYNCSKQLTGMSPEEMRDYVRARNSLNGMFVEEDAGGAKAGRVKAQREEKVIEGSYPKTINHK